MPSNYLRKSDFCCVKEPSTSGLDTIVENFKTRIPDQCQRMYLTMNFWIDSGALHVKQYRSTLVWRRWLGYGNIMSCHVKFLRRHVSRKYEVRDVYMWLFW